MRKTRVMFLIASFAIEGPQGGIERLVIELANHMDISQFEVTVCGLWHHGFEYERKWMNKLSQRGMTVLTTSNWTNNGLRDVFTSFRFLQKYLASQPPFDVVNSQAAYTDIVAIWLWATGKTKHLTRTIQNEKEWSHRSHLHFLLHNILAPLIFHVEISVSKKIKQDLDNRFLPQILKRQSQVIYNGIDLGRFNQKKMILPQKKTLLRIPENAYVIGNIGRLVPQKGHIYFLDMASQLLKQYPDCHFLIIGTGPLQRQLHQKMVDLNLQKAVHFLGAREDIEELLEIMDVYVSSSLWEGLSLVLLETMASKTPIVATKVSGTTELIENKKTGLITPPKDSYMLSKCVLQLLDNPTFAKKLAQTAYKHIQSFRIQHITQQYQQIFSELTR